MHNNVGFAIDDDSPPVVICVDGAAASGKSSICSALADEFSIPYFNAGLLYRALALRCVTEGVDTADADAVERVWHQSRVEVRFFQGRTVVFAGGGDVSAQLRSRTVSEVVPSVARHQQVRTLVNETQRTMVAGAKQFGGMIIDGRDARTAVAPDATVKFLLIADDAAISQREGLHPDTLATRRNEQDAQVSDFQRAGPDVHIINTSSQTIRDAIAEASQVVRDRIAALRDRR